MQQQLWEPDRATYERKTMMEVRLSPLTGLTAVSTFSGCGGSSLGLRMAGWDVGAAVEFVPAAAETYRANFPACRVVEDDIRKVSGAELLELMGLERGELDLLEGSPPCASFSQQGRRESGWGKVKKYSDTEQRTDDLFWEWARLLGELNPRAFIAENVPGMLTGLALETYTYRIMEELGLLGYQIAAKVLNAANFGTPQSRRRLIFVGYRNDLGIRPTFPVPTTPEPFTLRQALASVDEQDEDHRLFLEASSMEGTAVGRTWEYLTGRREKNVCARCGGHLREHRTEIQETYSVKKTRDEIGRRDRAVAFCADGERAIEVKDYALMTVPNLDEPCPTFTATGAATTSASVVHPLECRKLTPAEAKAVCGFPVDFALTGSREQRYERMGRAVCPPLYAVLGADIARRLGA